MPTLPTIITQPWFEAVGHPAQSLLNTARVLGPLPDLVYLISRSRKREDLNGTVSELRRIGEVHQFTAPANSLALSTCLAMLNARELARTHAAPVNIFFLDVHLLTLALTYPALARSISNLNSVSALILHGPEPMMRSPLRRSLLDRFLKRERVRLFLRTKELADAWRSAFASAHSKIDDLPSLEISDLEGPVAAAPIIGPTRFGIFGQIRPGKGLEWLVPLFKQDPNIGCLDIVGTFFNAEHRESLKVLHDYPFFQDRYIADKDLVPTAASADYLLTLYDPWDDRFEAATFFLAAKADRPVIAYDRGWCGRMIREFGCGIAIHSSVYPGREFFESVPQRGSAEYSRLVEGIRRFRNAYSSTALRGEFIRKVTGT